MHLENPLQQDLDHILGGTLGLWEELRGASLFITGGTGFFGRWLLESLAAANRVHDLGLSALVLCRDPRGFLDSAPNLAREPWLRFHVGDVRDFSFPPGRFSHLIHAATTSAAATFQGESPLDKFSTVVEGTRRVLEFARQSGVQDMLLTSSGTVYGSQPAGLERIPEDFAGAPDPLVPGNALGVSKRAAEFLCAAYGQSCGIRVRTARCFAFVGPHLQMRIHYAIGNFIRDALEGRPIVIQGDGTPLRSYLYASDLMIWLWHILLRGEPGRAYNVGSDQPISIRALGEAVAACAGTGAEVVVRGQSAGGPPNRYIPSIDRVRSELGLEPRIDLREAILRTMTFYRHHLM